MIKRTNSVSQWSFLCLETHYREILTELLLTAVICRARDHTRKVWCKVLDITQELLLQWSTQSFSTRQVVLKWFMWKSSSWLRSLTRISNEVTSKVALFCHKIPCVGVVKVVWGRGYSRCLFEGHLLKWRPFVQSITATTQRTRSVQMKTGINRISEREGVYQQCAM